MTWPAFRNFNFWCRPSRASNVGASRRINGVEATPSENCSPCGALIVGGCLAPPRYEHQKPDAYREIQYPPPELPGAILLLGFGRPGGGRKRTFEVLASRALRYLELYRRRSR